MLRILKVRINTFVCLFAFLLYLKLVQLDESEKEKHISIPVCAVHRNNMENTLLFFMLFRLFPCFQGVKILK